MKNPINAVRDKAIKELTQEWYKAKEKVAHLDSLLRTLETPEESVQREVKSWPEWKKNVQIGKIN